MWVGIHQPNFMPWIGFFHKMATVDHFIVLDNVQYTKGSVVNRVQVKAASGPRWFTVPIHLPNRLATTIAEVEIVNRSTWSGMVEGCIVQPYKKAPYFSLYWPELQRVLMSPAERLLGFNWGLVEVIRSWLHIETPYTLASVYGNQGEKNERIINLVRDAGGQAYLSGTGARNYNDPIAYRKAGITLAYQEFTHPQYKQLYGDWVPGCSVVDALFNVGPDFIEQFHQLVAQQRAILSEMTSHA